MARSLPPNPKACEGAADCLTRHLDRMMILQIVAQERSGPDRRMIAELTRVRVDDLGDQEIDIAVPCSGPSLTWGVGETSPQIESGALLQPTDIECRGAPLAEVAARLSQRHGVPIRLEKRALLRYHSA